MKFPCFWVCQMEKKKSSSKGKRERREKFSSFSPPRSFPSFNANPSECCDGVGEWKKKGMENLSPPECGAHTASQQDCLIISLRESIRRNVMMAESAWGDQMGWNSIKIVHPHNVTTHRFQCCCRFFSLLASLIPRLLAYVLVGCLLLRSNIEIASLFDE